jgi:hypothetical protein
MASTDTSLACVPVALPTKRGRGRIPVARSKARECRDRITAWKLTAEEKRQPPTLTALAAELGITKQLASYYAQQVPETIEQFVDGAERGALSRYPGILKTLGELAEKGSVEAIKVFIRELAAPRRPEKYKQSTLAKDIHLQQTLQVLLHSGDPNTRALSPTLETEPADLSKRQILSNSHTYEESTN